MRKTPFAALVTAVAMAACASPGSPPGGPVDTQAPQLVRTTPDSGRAGTRPREVVFRFDEVVSERPSGAASLNALFLISPRDGEPRVDWHRNEISVRPRRDWRANTTYTITLLPGLSDLRGNVRNTGAVTVFSTGATIPAGRITGTLFNWPEARVIRRGLVEARPLSDTSLVYLTSTDSVGHFIFGSMPPAAYTVRGISDENNNRALDVREAWDSVTVDLADSASIELLAFVRDSIGSRLQTVAVRDSVTLELIFDNPLSATDLVQPANVRVRAADSTVIGVLSVAPPIIAADTSVAAGPPAAARPSPVLPSRPAPPKSLIVKLARPLLPKIDYRITVVDVKNLIGVERTSDKVFNRPEPPPASPPPARVPVAPPPAPAPVSR